MEPASNRSLIIGIAVIVVIAVGAIAGAVFFTSAPQPASSQTSDTSVAQPIVPSGNTTQATFDCDGGKTIDVVFQSGTSSSAMLTLSDGRQMTLPQAASADGGRYASADGTFVFWNVGDSASITENGTTTYANCITQS